MVNDRTRLASIDHTRPLEETSRTEDNILEASLEHTQAHVVGIDGRNLEVTDEQEHHTNITNTRIREIKTLIQPSKQFKKSLLSSQKSFIYRVLLYLRYRTTNDNSILFRPIISKLLIHINSSYSY